MKSAKQQFSGFFIVRKGAFGHTCGVRVEGLWPEGFGRLMAAGCVEGLRKRVLKMDA